MDRSNNRNQRISEIEARLSELEGERKRLVVELTTLQSSTRSPDELPALKGLPALPSPPQTPDEKVDLFLSLFRARESVFPKLWENPSKGKKGYSPACRNEWARGICGKPQTKCSECPNQAFPLSTPRRLKTTFKANVRLALMPFAKTTPARSLQPISTVRVGCSAEKYESLVIGR